MSELESVNPIVHDRYKKDGFVIQRSDRYWAGLPCDLVIEQVLMRSLKSTGCLTRGSGMTAVQRAIWILSKPICSKYGLVMEENTGVLYTSSEQHQSATKSRVTRDKLDTDKVCERLSDVSPFTKDPSLQNIVNAVIANKASNVDDFYTIDERLTRKMVGQNVFNFEFKRSERVKNMSSEITLDEKADVQIDPALLFQRLLVVAQSNPVDMQEIMTYELSAYPLSLFESPTLLRKADKPKLMDAIVHQVKSDHTDELLDNTKGNTDEHILDDPENPTPVNEISTTDQYVLDGGSLLHGVRWTKHATYTEIANSCANFGNANYGKAVVVFDVYESGPSTKDMIHSRRTTKFVSRTINFSTSTKFVGLKERFLANTSNKERMIQLIGDTLQKSGCQVFYENGDADVKIAKTAVEESLTKHFTLIGEDTDL